MLGSGKLKAVMKLKRPMLLFNSLLFSYFAGFIGSFGTASSISTWYTFLVKPSFNPPNYLFGPVWTVLYSMMGVSLYLIWEKGYEKQEIKNAVNIFLIHLGVNALWSIIFFSYRELGWALFTIVILWGMIIYLIKIFWKIDRRAAYLLTPYLLWVSFATLLNYSIWMLN